MRGRADNERSVHGHFRNRRTASRFRPRTAGNDQKIRAPRRRPRFAEFRLCVQITDHPADHAVGVCRGHDSRKALAPDDGGSRRRAPVGRRPSAPPRDFHHVSLRRQIRQAAFLRDRYRRPLGLGFTRGRHRKILRVQAVRSRGRPEEHRRLDHLLPVDVSDRPSHPVAGDGHRSHGKRSCGPSDRRSGHRLRGRRA
ncbi:MAG: hypothetical protein BWY66_01442 [bacterium ADurb.Bin374]|nr:MAG: hypothetical protein BWY66_01442 [bacterium ADurb.Bin374]